MLEFVLSVCMGAMAAGVLVVLIRLAQLIAAARVLVERLTERQ